MNPRNQAWLFVFASGMLIFLAGCNGFTDSQRLVGKWEGSLDTMEFFSNGDLRIYAMLATHSGNWELPGDGRLKLVTEGLLGMTAEWKYELDGDKLVLRNMANPDVMLEYKRKRS